MKGRIGQKTGKNTFEIWEIRRKEKGAKNKGRKVGEKEGEEVKKKNRKKEERNTIRKRKKRARKKEKKNNQQEGKK